jgi:hypothetical protein
MSMHPAAHYLGCLSWVYRRWFRMPEDFYEEVPEATQRAYDATAVPAIIHCSIRVGREPNHLNTWPPKGR